jgi:hypothetical protein
MRLVQGHSDLGGKAGERTRQGSSYREREAVCTLRQGMVALPDTTLQLNGGNWRTGEPIMGNFFEDGGTIAAKGLPGCKSHI